MFFPLIPITLFFLLISLFATAAVTIPVACIALAYVSGALLGIANAISGNRRLNLWVRGISAGPLFVAAAGLFLPANSAAVILFAGFFSLAVVLFQLSRLEELDSRAVRVLAGNLAAMAIAQLVFCIRFG